MLRSLITILVLLLPQAALGAPGQSLPPGERPVQVVAGFYLLDLSSVAERDETFDADIYLKFQWRDPRQAFVGSESRMFLQESAAEQIGKMWWPQIEFVNTGQPEITNRRLEIYPDGTVDYDIGLTSRFRAHMDLRRFPFDRQGLDVRIQSFAWTAEQLEFVPDETGMDFSPESTFEGLLVTGVSGAAHQSEHAGWGRTFSEFVARIEVERRWTFFVWTVFVPVTLIFLVFCTVFLVPSTDFAARIDLSLTALLACIATQFAMSFNLPHVSYLTVIDEVFLAAYCSIALGVATSTGQAAWLKHEPERSERIDRRVGLGLPLLYFALLGISILS